MQVTKIICNGDRFKETITSIDKIFQNFNAKSSEKSVPVDQRTYIQRDRNIHHKLNGRGGRSDKFQGKAKSILSAAYRPEKKIKEIQ